MKFLVFPLFWPFRLAQDQDLVNQLDLDPIRIRSTSYSTGTVIVGTCVYLVRQDNCVEYCYFFEEKRQVVSVSDLQKSQLGKLLQEMMFQTTLTAATAVPSSSLPREDPLECVIKEQIRDEHLKNLGMKRNKSIRKSIAKRLRKREKLKEEEDFDRDSHHDVPDSGGDGDKENRGNEPVPAARMRRRTPPTGAAHVETRTSIGSQIEGGKRVEVIRVDPRKQTAPLIGEPQPLPAHLIADSPRKMDRLRRSIRHGTRERYTVDSGC